MHAIKLQPLLSVEDCLAGERVSDVRHEYSAGEVFAMAGGSQRHSQLIFVGEISLECPALSFTLDQLYSGTDIPAVI